MAGVYLLDVYQYRISQKSLVNGHIGMCTAACEISSSSRSRSRERAREKMTRGEMPGEMIAR